MSEIEDSTQPEWSDFELPGMWERADFEGGLDEVRPPAADAIDVWRTRATAAEADADRLADELFIAAARDRPTKGMALVLRLHDEALALRDPA